MKITAHQQASVFDELQPEWNELLRRSTSDLLFLTWEWQSTWWNAYEAGDLWVLSCRTDDGRLIGIAPWFIQDNDGERVLRTIGCVDVTDYVDIIADRNCVEPVQFFLARFLAANRDKFDRINLCNIPEDSPTYTQFPEKLRENDFHADTVLQEVCPVIHLPNDWEAYLGMLDKKQRHEIRRKIRKAESEAKLERYVVGEEHDFQAEAERFLSLMAASQPSKAEFLRDPNNLRFFKNILNITRETGWLRLSFLKCNDTHVAAYCDFDYNGHILVYNSGLLPESYAQLSPGIVLLAYNIKHAIETGHRVYDFLRGNETYKYRMGAEDTRVYKLVARARVSAKTSA
ncbi:MAG TPA: GNAT family N-acetyltransferase [Oceanobacillus sp.]|nr:GNAT family N-acetyltransferase [Oceanobacillus sp.]